MEEHNSNNISNIQNEPETSINDSGYQDISIDNPSLLMNKSEQEAMSDLNNRLAVYIGHMRSLENQANTIKSFEEMSEIPSIQLENLKLVYECEINDLRSALDNQSITLASLTIRNNKLNADKENAQIIINDQSKQISKLKETATNLELENASLKYQLTILEDNQTFTKNLEDQLKKCQEQLEEEVLLRTSSENACLTYKEKLEFNDAVFKKELGALMTSHKLTLKNMAAFQNNVSMTLYEEMEDARNQLKDNLNEFQDLIKENLFDTIDNAVDSICARNMHLSQLKNANNLALEDQHKLLIELDKIKTSHAKLENQLSDIQILNEEEIKRLNALVFTLTGDKLDKLEKQFSDFQNLRDSLCEKAFIDEELAIYRKMLDSEETRTDFHSPVEAKRAKIFRESDENIANRRVLKPVRRTKRCTIM